MKETGQEAFTSAVLVPAGQALLSGGFIGLAAGALAWVLEASNPLAVALATGAIVTALAWLGLRSGWERRLEAILGVSNQPPPQVAKYGSTVRVEVVSDQARAGDWLDLPGGPDRLQELARGLVEGRPFTVRMWAGSLYTGAEFDQLRSELIQRGLARWRSERDPRGGAELTSRGRAVMRAIADQPPHCPTQLPAASKVVLLEDPHATHTKTQQG